MTSLLFHNFKFSQGADTCSFKSCDFVWDAIFFICTHAYLIKDHLAVTWNYYPRLRVLKNRNTVHGVPGHGIEEHVYALCCQLNEALSIVITVCGTLVFRQGELALSSIQERLTEWLKGCLGQWFFSQYSQCSYYL